MNRNCRHDYYLNQLINRLHEVNENPSDISWIMVDGIWMPRGSTNRKKLCDIVAVYYDRKVSCIELKGSTNKRKKARVQLASSEKFVREMLGFNDIRKKIVYYTNDYYNYEEV